MMKRLLTAVILLLCMIEGYAQQRIISGVVKDNRGEPVAYATVTESVNNQSTVTDAAGKFSMVAGRNARITVTAVGFESRTVDGAEGLTITLNPSANSTMKEVVVTAMGIRRKPESVGYATSTVRPEQLTAGRNFNMAQALSGKASGLTITNTSSSVNATPRITLRGIRSLTGNNQALIVLDGVQVPASTINFINPNDVEQIDILKGGQAATLFGSEGVNGAIVITTRKGTQKPEISIMHTNNVEMVSFLPKFQTGFGSGSGYGANQQENFHPGENQQFGDRYDGSLRPVGRRLADGTILLAPYSHNPNSRKDLWDRGNTGQTDFSYRAGDANSSFFASYQNLYSNGVVFGDSYYRNSIRLNSSRVYGKFALSFDANYVWDRADRTNIDFYGLALNTASWIPVSTLKDWKNNKFGNMNGYFNDYINSPWWSKDNNRFETRNTVLNANIKLSFKPIQSLEFIGRVAINSNGSTTGTTGNSYTFSSYANNSAPVDYFNNNYDRLLTGRGRSVARTNLTGGVGENASNSQRVTGDFLGTYRKKFGLVELNAIAGIQAIATYGKSSSVSTGGIGVPDLYNLANTATGVYSGSNGKSETRKIGGYVDVTVGFKSYLYFHGSYRNDYTSVFSGPAFGYNDPSFSTYGGDVSLIVSDLVPSIKGKVLDNLKIRASYNQNTNDNLGAYGLQQVFPNASGFPYSGLLGTTVGNVVVAPNLTPERVRSSELGFELGLLNNRIFLEATYYHQNADRQILDVDISSAAGSAVYRLNAADVVNKGFELDLKTNIIRTEDWRLNVNLNYTYNKNKVNTLYGQTGLNSFPYQSTTLYNLNAEVGQMFPYLRTTRFARDSATGKVIVSAEDGWPLREEQKVGQGTTLPVHVLGVGFTASWKNFTLQANAEYRGGHVVYHSIGETMTFTGTAFVTGLYNRETFVWPNSVIADPSNPGKYIANTNTAVSSYKAMYQGFGDFNFPRGLAGVGETYVSSGAFWKVRDISLSYDFPTGLIRRSKFLKGITITAFARNPIVLLPSDNIYTDPEFGNAGNSSNGQGVNSTLNTPPTRQFGGVLKVTF